METSKGLIEPEQSMTNNVSFILMGAALSINDEEMFNVASN